MGLRLWLRLGIGIRMRLAAGERIQEPRDRPGADAE
jgi:hypothetical protein